MAFIHKHSDGYWNFEEEQIIPNIQESLQSKQVYVIKTKNNLIYCLDEHEAKIIKVAPKLLECTEMLHDYLIGKDSIILNVVKEVLKEAGVLTE